MSKFLQDFRLSWRLLTRRPWVALTTVVTLSLGLGACATVFTVVDDVLLAALPYPEPERLVLLWESHQQMDASWRVASLPTVADWQSSLPELRGLAANRAWRPILALGDQFEGLRGAKVTAGFFDLLGVEPMLGRTFVAEDDRPGAAKVLILGHDLWQRRFGGDPEILGRRVRLDDEGKALDAEVIGILPAQPPVLRPVIFEEAEIWTPLALDIGREPRGQRIYRVLGRLTADASFGALEEKLAGVSAALAQAHPKTNEGWQARIDRLDRQMISPVRPALLALLAAVAFVYLIACTNAAVLLMVQEADRSQEIAVRLALGAGPARIGRQLFCEGCLLTGAGCVGGLLLARGVLALLGSVGFDSLPRGGTIAMDHRVVVFAGLLALFTSLLFGVLQAIRASRVNIRVALASRFRVDLGTWKLRRLLVLAEITWSLILLVAAGLMLRSVHHLLQVDPGFDAEQVLTLRLDAPPSLQPDKDTTDSLFQQVLERVSWNGTHRAGLVNHLPMQGVDLSTVAWTDIRPREEGLQVEFRGVSSGYFSSMGIELLAGRDLARSASPENSLREVVVNRAAAQLLWPTEELFGVVDREFFLAWGSAEPRRVVGVVADVLNYDLRQERARPAVYLPYLEVPHRSMTLVMRVDESSRRMLSDLVDWANERNRAFVVHGVERLEEKIYRTTAQPRAYTWLLAAFALVSLLLAAGGTYSVVACTVTERRKDFGVRAALGAQPEDLLRSTMAEGLWDGLLGVLLGLGGSILLTRMLSGMLFGVSASDPWTLGAMAILMFSVVFLASYIPALRATRVDPAAALRRS